jgi:hypothetical protein
MAFSGTNPTPRCWPGRSMVKRCLSLYAGVRDEGEEE